MIVIITTTAGSKIKYKLNENNELICIDDDFVEHKAFVKDGKYHCDDGPALIYTDGHYKNNYFYNGLSYKDIKSDEQWRKFLKCKILW